MVAPHGLHAAAQRVPRCDGSRRQSPLTGDAQAQAQTQALQMLVSGIPLLCVARSEQIEARAKLAGPEGMLARLQTLQRRLESMIPRMRPTLVPTPHCLRASRLAHACTLPR